MLKAELYLQSEIAERANNFRWNTEFFQALVLENEKLFLALGRLKGNILSVCNTEAAKKLPKEELLKKVFTDIYNLIELPARSELVHFLNDAELSKSVYEALLFTTLGSFLHGSKRIKGKRLIDFVYDHSPLNLSKSDFAPSAVTDMLHAETVRLRKARNRRLSEGKAYYKNSQWTAITKDAEHEWTFYFALESSDEAVQDTFKRLGNLYKGLDDALDADKDDNYAGKLNTAYGKFESKLRKIQYSNYVKLQQAILEHIKADQTYWGLNLYRLERKLKPYAITNEVKTLAACQDKADESRFLLQSVILQDIEFPAVHAFLSSLEPEISRACSQDFSVLRSNVELGGCLILDALVEAGVFGDDWETLFRDMTNRLAERVLYDPEKLDFTVTEHSQQAFEKLLAAPVKQEFSKHTDNSTKS